MHNHSLSVIRTCFIDHIDQYHKPLKMQIIHFSEAVVVF